MGLVTQRSSEDDGRVTHAVLTDAGQKKLEHASRSHGATVRAALAEHYSDDEVDTLIELLGRLAGDAAGGCGDATLTRPPPPIPA